MDEEELVNTVSKIESNGNITQEKNLDDTGEKMDLEPKGGKILESNAVKDLKEDGIKEMEVDEKAIGEEELEVEEDKEVDDGSVIIGDSKVGDVEEIKEDKKVDEGEILKEDKKVDEGEELKEDMKVDDKKKDIKVEKRLKKCERGKVNMEKVKKKIKKQEIEGISEDKDESNEKDKSQEGEEDGKDKVVDKSNIEKVSDDIEVEKRLKKRRRGNIHEETEPRTTSTNRPVRERKSVERLIESDEKDASKEFYIEQGRGTPLKDIPNVAFKLSRRKIDDTLKSLHTILFGRRGKAVEIKNNISKFSGFAWHENEEKQMIKVKEKFDKCKKEKLLEFCDVLDIHVATKANTRKEDIIAKLIDFLVAPQATEPVLHGEQEKSIKGKTRKRTAKQGSSTYGTATSRRSAKSQKKNEDSSVAEERKSATDTENEFEEEEKDEENESEHESYSDYESEIVKKVSKTKKTYSKKKGSGSAAKSKAKKTTVETKSRVTPKRTTRKSFSYSELDDYDDSEGSPETFSKKQKTKTPTKSSSKDETEKVANSKGKNKEKTNPDDDQIRTNPSDDQIRSAICDILKENEADRYAITFGDIVDLIGKRFDMDPTPRKKFIKYLIQKEVEKLVEEEIDREEAEREKAKLAREEAEKEKTKS